MAKLIGTAGHVDHGKTTLIQALTGIDADRLPEEKRRGMTIDIGFAYIDLPEHGRVSIVDVPGHERFLTNMLVGALGIDVALLCVAADESVMPQTREHLQILELLPVEKLVVALTRSDLADDETRELSKAEVEELIASSRFKTAPIVEVIATKGAGIENLKTQLSKALSDSGQSEIRNPKSEIQPWYLPIDRAFAVKGHGVVVTGTLAQGSVKAGDSAHLEPGHVQVRVRSIHSHGDEMAASEKGKRTALNLSGVKLEDVRRGMAVGEPGALFETSLIDARMHWVTKPSHAMRVRVSIGAEEAIAKLFLSDADPNLAQLRLESPVACALGQPLIVRRYSPPDLIGGGRVIVPQATPRKKADQIANVVEATNDEEAILKALTGQNNGLSTDELARRLGKAPPTISGALKSLEDRRAILGFSGQWFSRETFESTVTKLLSALGELHESNPTESAIPRDKALKSAGLTWSGKPLDRIIATLSEQGKIESLGAAVRLPDFQVKLNPRQRDLLDRIKTALESAGINVPSAEDLARNLGIPRQAVEDVFRLGQQTGELIRVADGMFYARSQIEELKNRIRNQFGEKQFAAAELRDAFGTTRKYAIPLLEYLDSVRFTLRVGDSRVVRKE